MCTANRAQKSVSLPRNLTSLAALHGALEQREAKIRRLFEANIIGIFVWDVEGRILDANEAFLRIVQYDREDVLAGRVRWSDAIHRRPAVAGGRARLLEVPPEDGVCIHHRNYEDLRHFIAKQLDYALKDRYPADPSSFQFGDYVALAYRQLATRRDPWFARLGRRFLAQNCPRRRKLPPPCRRFPPQPRSLCPPMRR